MHRSVELMWADYLAHHPQGSTAMPPAWHFCANEEDANECARLVLAGTKRATSPSLWSFETASEALPQTDDLNIVTDWSGKAICIIRTTKVQVLPLNEITETHARLEGEGDGSLAWWHKEHWDYYHHELQGTGRVPQPDMPIVFHEFECIFSAPLAARLDSGVSPLHEPMQPITIRHLEPADIAQVHALYSEPHAYADTLQLPFQPIASWEKKLDCSRPGAVCLVALRGDEVQGQLGLEVFQSPRRRHVATFGMGVRASARGTGVGSALVAAAIEICEKWLNVSRIELEVYSDNEPAVRLYHKHGFVVEGTCRNYAFRNGQYVSAHVMARVVA